jgi:hypothetical protein
MSCIDFYFLFFCGQVKNKKLMDRPKQDFFQIIQVGRHVSRAQCFFYWRILAKPLLLKGAGYL